MQDRRQPGLAFGVLLQRYLDRPPDRTRMRRPWSPEEFGAAVGATSRAVRFWLTGQHIPRDTTAIERILFGAQVEAFEAEITELRAAARLGRYKRSERFALPDGRAALASTRIYSDPAVDLPVLNYQDIDLLPVDETWRFSEIRYGEGVQTMSIPGHRLMWLEPTVQLTSPAGVRRSLTAFFPEARAEIDALAREQEIFFPRRIVIYGPKRRDAVVRIFACTDAPYPNGLEDGDGDAFSAEALLGLGGIAAFVDRAGALRPRSAVEIGGGLGCVVVLAAVAYVNRRPRYRTPYCLMVRKGMRYPDDVWRSPATGLPVFSAPEPAAGRFLFQSRESKGGATDMFAANFNGSGLVNLNEADESAWDGFTDEAGRNLVTWDGNRITFGSLVRGNGFIEVITREDRP